METTPPQEPEATGNNSNTENCIISMHDFLEFLKLTCQVNEHLEEDFAEGDSKLDYSQLAQNPLINSLTPKDSSQCPNGASSIQRKNAMHQSSNSLEKKDMKRAPRKCKDGEQTQSPLNPALQSKLDEVVEEGILDSVLQYMGSPSFPNTPRQNVQQSPVNITAQATTATIKQNMLPAGHESMPIKGLDNPSSTSVSLKKGHLNNVVQSTSKDKMSRRKSTTNQTLAEVMVTIHVCDEVKNVTRDFTCQQALLVGKMGYFADVTAGQRLEDMDISVHCDVQIFEWLMRWVKRESMPPDMWSQLDATNVVPILVSASFLQMEPLLVDCLSFCHANLTDVIRSSANMSCLNDTIISRLAAMFTNLELEAVKDKKDRFVPRLWTKLIQSLCEPEPQSLRGHYSSMVDLFRCNRCCQYLTHSVASFVYCVPQSMRMNRWGQIVSQHVRDPSWNLGNYVAALQKELRSWRKVYWRLWGNCHYLYCVTCETHFPANRMKWCLYHSEAPQFLGPVTEGRMAGPTGRYPCCGQQAFRYEPVPGPTGCQYRDHSVQIESDRDRAILRLCQIAEGGGCLYEQPPTTATHNQLCYSGSSEQWWNGLALAPNRNNDGLLPTITDDNQRTRMRKKFPIVEQDSSSDPESCETIRKFRQLNRLCSTSSDGCESDETSCPSVVVPKASGKSSKRNVKPVSGRHWSGDISARSNQDNQREFEERAMKQVIAIVGKRTGSDTNLRYQNHHQGGMYVKLEAEWRESVRQKLIAKAKK